MSIRTTVTLDDDVVARLKEESRSQGLPFRNVLNETIRIGLNVGAKPVSKPFKTRVSSMGRYPGLNYDCIGELLEQVEGPMHR